MKRPLTLIVFILLFVINAGAQIQGTWIPRGPYSINNAYGNVKGVGRTACITIDPLDSNNILVIGSSGDLWKSTDEGNTWSVFSVTNPNFVFWFITYDPTNSNVLYAQINNPTSHLFKSTDGGVTWNQLNPIFDPNFFKLLIDPFNSQNLLISSNNGISKSTNGGTTWDIINSTPYGDLEMNPLNPMVLYGISTSSTIKKSTDGGVTFTSCPSVSMANGIDDIGLTAADTNYVYLFSVNNAGNGQGQVALSTNGGNSFVVKPMASVLVCWSGLLQFHVSPTNKDLLMQGGIRCARSTNGGTSWSYSPSFFETSPNYVHDDYRFATFYGSSYWVCTDGGINKTMDGGATWTDKTPGLSISVIMSLASCRSDSSQFIVGSFDNASQLYQSGVWNQTFSGDGFNVLIHPTNPQIIFGKNQYNYFRSTNGGVTPGPFAVFSGCSESIYAFDTQYPAIFNFQNPNSMFLLAKNVWKSTNGGSNVSVISSFPTVGQGGGFIYNCSVDSNIIYTKYYHTTNGGTTWIANTKRVLAVDPDEPNKVWAQNNALEPYELFYSSNGGSTWNTIPTYDIGSGANNIRCANNTNNGIFIFTGVNIYYRDDGLSNWQPFNNGLPPIKINDMNVLDNYGRVRVGTNGRGVWESGLFDTTLALVTDFIPSAYSICPNDTVQFFDNSLNNGPSYSPVYNWSFPGGIPSTSTAISPEVVYPSPGTYTVTLTVTNSTGVSTASHTVTVNTSTTTTITAGGAVPFCESDSVVLTTNTATSYLWSTGATTQSIFVSDSGSYSVISYYSVGCSGTDTMLISTMEVPDIGASSSDNLICQQDSVTLNGIGDLDVIFVWSGGIMNGIAFQPSSTMTYTVTGTDENSCSNTSTVTVTVNDLPSVMANATDNNLCIGDATTLTGSGASTYAWSGGINNGVSFNPSSTITYTVTGTDINSCTNTNSITITVNNLPNVTASATDVDLCMGDPTTLTGGGALSYTWTGGVTEGISFNPSSTITYTVTGTDANSCSNTNTITVAVNNLPSVTANATDVDLCTGDPTTLTGSGASSYTWTGGMTDGISFNPTSTTTYTVTGTDANSCSNTSTITVTVNNLPIVIATATDSILCLGDPTTLSGSGASSYTWNGGVIDGVAFNPSSTITYTVTGTDGNVCSSTSSITITVNNLPVVGATATDTVLCNGDPLILTGSGASSYTWTGGVFDGVSFNPSATATYTVTGTDVNACTDTDTIAVLVNTLPTVTANASDIDICNGEPVTLTGSGASSYSWSDGVLDAIAFNPIATATYTVTGTDLNSCSATSTITITVNDLPIVTLNYTGPDTVCITYGLQTLNGGSPSGGTYTGTGVTGNDFDPSVAGLGNHIISYEYTDTNACSNTDVISITVIGCAGVDDYVGSSIVVYPNPFEHMILIDGLRNQTEIRLYNTLGEIVGSWILNVQSNVIYVDDLSSGIYYLILEDDQNQTTRKLIRQ